MDPDSSTLDLLLQVYVAAWKLQAEFDAEKAAFQLCEISRDMA